MPVILPFTDALAPAFRAINAAWIEEMFVLEAHDEHVLDHPREAIVEPGGRSCSSRTMAILGRATSWARAR
ncbi:hypothetical protein [uncultured Sphingomonas sp.]|uniref:hypothetical protein n=1 Tax=uncultured Sphingomonas sp. TaxID=158754 RepID=UPI0035CC7FEC